MSKKTIALIGNPNSGKTTLFNILTGSRQKVGNWPGVTVERKTGLFKTERKSIKIVDLPGIYSINGSNSLSRSIDEYIAQNYLLSGEYDYIVNIIDASNLDRSLYLTSQLLDMQVPIIIVLNMMDIARRRKIQIDVEQMSKMLGVPIIPIIAKKKQGLDCLIKTLISHKPKSIKGTGRIFNRKTERVISEVLPMIKGNFKRWYSLQLLQNPNSFSDLKNYKIIKRKVQEISVDLKSNLSDLITKSRYEFIEKVIRSIVKKPKEIIQTTSDSIDKIVLHKWLGVPIFLGVMYLLFFFTVNVSSVFVNFFDKFSEIIFMDNFRNILQTLHAPKFLQTVLADGLGGGIHTVATFIPILLFLYMFLSVLEDSGYMARAAVIMDRFMKKLGLSGKAFVPLCVGFGCSVPAVMSARTMKSLKDRIAVIIMTPFMSCGAKLPVYVLFATVFFPDKAQNIVFILYLLGILSAIFTGLVFKAIVCKKERNYLLIELPSYNLPRIKDIFLNTWNRLKIFIFGSGKVIVIIVMILTTLNSIKIKKVFEEQNAEDAFLSKIGQIVTPVFKPIGIKKENWPATVGIFTGIFAKEVVIGTLDSLYHQTEPEQTISETMKKMFNGKIGAFAYMLFILLYTPCIPTLLTIREELGTIWAGIVATWTFVLAYLVSILVYQTGALHQNHNAEILWILGTLIFFGLIILFLERYSKKYIEKNSCVMRRSSEACKNRCCFRQ